MKTLLTLLTTSLLAGSQTQADQPVFSDTLQNGWQNWSWADADENNPLPVHEGKAANSGLGYYHLDNEPGLWHSSHRDVHPKGATMDEIRDKSIALATRIKATDHVALLPCHVATVKRMPHAA